MTNDEKGARGERLVAMALEHAFPNAKRFDSMIIPATDGLTQIDHVLVSTEGIFVIEVKKYSGDIIGSADAPMWLQRIGSYRREFQNPIWQNARHVAALRWQLKLSPDQLHSIVVFVGRTELVRSVASNVITTSAAGCLALIQHIQRFSDERLTAGEVNRAEARLRQIESAGYTEKDLLRSIRERRSRCASLQSSTQATALHGHDLRGRDPSSASNRLSLPSRTSRLPSSKTGNTGFGVCYPFFRLLRWSPSTRP